MTDPLTIIHGDALSSLRALESESVQCVVTSPPYWGLRDYGVEGQLGLEKTPDEYVARLVEIFREVKRVLHGHGTLWLNLGDTYCGYWGDAKALTKGERSSADTNGWTNDFHMNARPKYDTLRATGLKPKDLVGIPWMVAFALRADGWYLRSDIIWAKPNPMPESVTDRPTKSHEYIFLLSKSDRYYYNAKAIAEPLDCPEELDRRTPAKFGGANKWAEAQKQSRLHSGNEYRRKPSTNGKWSTEDPQSSGRRTVENVARARDEGGAHDSPFGDTRNKRSVWTITTKPFKEAHFATFPPDLITPCILAGAEAGATVLDPFAGSGTTGKVAIELGRKALLIEPKAEYIEMIKRRCQTTIGLPITA